eukprot:6482434-Amphidinium_carterae.1
MLFVRIPPATDLQNPGNFPHSRARTYGPFLTLFRAFSYFWGWGHRPFLNPAAGGCAASASGSLCTDAGFECCRADMEGQVPNSFGYGQATQSS